MVIPEIEQNFAHEDIESQQKARHSLVIQLQERGAKRELGNYRTEKKRQRKADQPSDTQKEQMEALLNKLKEESIEAKGEVGFVTRLTTKDWNIIVRGTGNNKSRGTVFSYRNPESILSHNDGRVFSEEDVALVHKLIMDPRFDYVEFKDTAKIISYRKENLSPTIKLSAVELCEKELRNRMSGKSLPLSNTLNPQEDTSRKGL